MFNQFYLDPLADGAKSFYNKALVTEYNDGSIVLTSYQTKVASIIKGEFRRHWGGYSVTTMRHINSFLRLYNIDGGGKKWWDNVPVYVAASKVVA